MMNPPRPIEEILASLPSLSRHRILVVGDLFLDEYVEGEMIEISKEGPIPVVAFRSRATSAGAAGNLASSIRNLGAQVSVVGVVGDDANGATLLAELGEKEIDTRGIVVDAEKPTLTYGKIRAFVENAPSREILRLDVLPDGPLRGEIETRVLERLSTLAAEADAIIVLDQIDQLITPRLLESVVEMKRKHSLFLQGSSRDHLARFSGFDLVVPNDREAAEAIGTTHDEPVDPEHVGRTLLATGGHAQVLLTLGPDGMACVLDADSPIIRIPTYARDIVDVTGAGDAVSSTVILGRLEGWDLTTAAWCASHSAAIALSHVGTHHVTRAELEAALLAVLD
jgi:rfaE bifunctional protein kinase chain/domain